MIVIRNLDSQEIDADEAAIILIAGPHPHDAGPHTYVYGVTGLKSGLGKAAAVISIRRPVANEQQGLGR